MRIILSVFSFAAGLAQALTSPPPGALVVGKTYARIQDAVDVLNTTSAAEQIIFIEAGTYHEQIDIPALSGPLMVYGYSESASGYAGNQVILIYSDALANEDNDYATATLRVRTSDFKMYNVDVKNTYGQADTDGQALAISAEAEDTVLAETGSQLYAKCYIEGATDFIFGQRAAAWFDGCDIRVLEASLGFITASGRSSNDTSYYVINNSTIAAVDGADVPSGAYYLGRPWREYARVAFQGTSMSEVVNPAGWSVWSTVKPQTDHVAFGKSPPLGLSECIY
ncbi:pectin lyase-like protein [Hortaea werneckii]|nr:pectin lyase-like protein [Hortaea werneckii]KAI6888076.1 pectin lyase-like protein [Hortaea werneckii]KAI7001469.1 pectin lyase-like protein [Hortaea werneckii]KAI7149483.1 pectin lyase-like protein [Hortaea werneckii]KAI7175319.1 pectin lyase-like protein [Hortaea werneckii]